LRTAGESRKVGASGGGGRVGAEKEGRKGPSRGEKGASRNEKQEEKEKLLRVHTIDKIRIHSSIQIKRLLGVMGLLLRIISFVLSNAHHGENFRSTLGHHCMLLFGILTFPVIVTASGITY